MKTLICFLTAAVICTGASASDARSIENYAADYAVYATYFHILSQATAQSGAKYAETSKTFDAKCDEFLLISLALAEEARTTKMAEAVTLSRFESFKKDMLNEIEYRNENISILMNKYHEDAMKLATNPPLVVVRVLERRAEKLSQQR